MYGVKGDSDQEIPYLYQIGNNCTVEMFEEADKANKLITANRQPDPVDSQNNSFAKRRSRHNTMIDEPALLSSVPTFKPID